MPAHTGTPALKLQSGTRSAPRHRLRCPTSTRCHLKNGAQGRNRTTDTRIFSPLLYRLSYLGLVSARIGSSRESCGGEAGYSTTFAPVQHPGRNRDRILRGLPRLQLLVVLGRW